MPKRFEHGVVIGKFLPPHRGHKFLIDTAAAQCESVTVIVCDKAGQPIPGERRASWLREIHPGTRVIRFDDVLADDDTPGWAKATVDLLGGAPDAVFSSEDYGPGYAAAMGCAHVMVDRARTAFPVSGTSIRRDPLAQWQFLEPCVRAHFARRVCVLGAESTGTTTMARALAEKYRTVWAPEYGRVFSEGKYAAGDPAWSTAEFVHIAEQQSAMEDWLARSANKLVVCDTDPFATTIWHERYMGRPSAAVKAIADARRYDLYLLTADDIPFVQDGTRDGEHLRNWMHGRFEEALAASGRPYVVLRGTHAERLREASALIDGLLSEVSRACAILSPCATAPMPF